MPTVSEKIGIFCGFLTIATIDGSIILSYILLAIALGCFFPRIVRTLDKEF